MIEFVHDLQARGIAPVPATQAKAWPFWLGALVLAAVVYVPAALGASFLNFDDNFYFGPDNPEFRAGIGAVLDPQRRIANAWLPVAHLSLWLDFAWTGTAPLWPHLHSVLLHGLCGFVLARLLLQLGASRFVAAGTAALFVVHPTLAESVAWVSGRKDVLSGLFTFLTLLLVVQHARRPRALLLLGIGLATALAMYSKATAVVLPLLAGLVLAHVGGRRERWVAALVVALVTAPIAWHHQLVAAAEGTLADGAVGERLAQVPGAYLHYMAKALWPHDLNVLYPEVTTLQGFVARLPFGLAGLLALVLAAAVAWWLPRWRLVGLGLLGFLCALLPFNTAFPASSIAAADRYLYLALPFLGLAVATTCDRLGPVRFAVALPVLVLAWLAGGRAHDFRDSQSLWQASLAADRDNAVAHLNLVYDQFGKPALFAEVRAHLEHAARVARYPEHERQARELLVRLAMFEADYPRAAREAEAAIDAAERQLARERSDKRVGKATALLLAAQLAAFEPLRLAGDETGAARVLAAARGRLPDHPDVVAFQALLDLGGLRDELLAKARAGGSPTLAPDDARAVAALAKLAAAQAAFEREHGRKHAGLAFAMGEWQRGCDQPLAALRFYNEAVQADPDCVPAWLGSAKLLRERETWESAEAKARAGLARRPDPALRQELALALIGQGRLLDAEQQLEAYLRVRPEDNETGKVLANVLIGRAYAQLGNQGERASVRRLVDRALALNPKEAKAHLVLGRLAKEDGRTAEAVQHLEVAHKLLPTFDDARQLYTDALASLGYEQFLRRDENAAIAAWQQCLAVAPAGFDAAGIRDRLHSIWQKHEAAGVTALQVGDRAAAAIAFRRCLQLEPDQHWAAWLLGLALQDDPAADLAELERLGRMAVAWQTSHGEDAGQQVLWLARVLLRAGKSEAGRTLAGDYLKAPAADAKPQVLQALRTLRGD
jgi:tetratricopeptide (TPR) repeat protein